MHTACQDRALRMSVLAWFCVSLLLVLVGVNPPAASASILQMHGALHREGAVGIVSHRGAAAIAPENTLAAMQIAIDQGVDFVEADVHLTVDGVPVLMHDPTLDRTTDGTGHVWAKRFADVRELDAGGWFSAEYAGEQVPTLEEFLELLGTSNTRALVELKGVWTDEQLSQVADELRAHRMVNRVALQSFELETLETLKEVAPEFARLLLTREWNELTVEQALQLRVSAVGARTKLVEQRPELLDTLREVGIGSLVYTLNAEEKWQQACDRGIDLVVTDDPVSLAEWRGADGDGPAWA